MRVVIGAVLTVLGLLGSMGVAFAACAYSLATSEPPSPAFQLPTQARDGQPAEGTTPVFGGGWLAPGPYTVDVWGNGTYGCHLIVDVPNEPPHEDRKSASTYGLCRVDVTARAGESWHIRGEVTGDTTAYVSVRPVESSASLKWARLPFAGCVGLFLAGVGLLIIHAIARKTAQN